MNASANATLGCVPVEAAAAVSRTTIVDFKRGSRMPHRNNLLAIQNALEKAGIEFIAENGGGPGVRLSRRVSPD